MPPPFSSDLRTPSILHANTKTPKKGEKKKSPILLPQRPILLVGPRDTLLDDLPEPGNVQGPRYPDPALSRRQDSRNGASRLCVPVLGLLKGALRDDSDLKALFVRGRGALVGVPFVEGDLVAGADEDGGYGDGVMKGRAGGDAEDVAG